MVTARSAVERHGVSASTAHQALCRLGESGVLAEMTGGRYAKVYAAQEVMSLLHRPLA